MPRRSVVLIDPYCDGHHLHYATALASGLHARGIEIYAVGGKGFIEGLKRSVALTDSAVVDLSVKAGILGVARRIRFLFVALRHARRFKPTYVHILQLDGYIVSLFVLFPFFRFLRIFVTLHWTYFLDQVVPDRFFYKLKGGFQRKALSSLVERGLGVMVHSPKLAQILNQFTVRSTVGYVPYPVEIAALPSESAFEACGRALRSQFGIPPDAVVLICFGGTALYKGVDIAIRALSYLPAGVYLLIAGREEHFTSKMIADLGRQLGVQERIKVHAHFIPDDQVINYFAAADIALFPYRIPFSGQSGPLTVAAYLGIPVVASNSPVLQEHVEKYSLGAIFQATDAGSLAAAVSSVLDSDLRPDTERFRRDHCASSFCQSVVDYYDNQLVFPDVQGRA